MNSSLYGKIEKAKRYLEQPERISFNNLNVTFNGEHSPHTVSLEQNHWHCDCSSFHSLGSCSHVMAMQSMLNPMLTADARYDGPDPELLHSDGATDNSLEPSSAMTA